MGTIADKLNRVIESKSQIKEALVSKGVEIPDDTPFRSYPSLVDNIQTGGADLNIVFGDEAPEDTSKLWVNTESIDTPGKVALFNSNVETTVSTARHQTRILDVKLPSAATNMAVSAVGSKIYLFGGIGQDGYLDTINVFDTKNETLVTLETRLFGSNYDMTAVTVGTSIYLFGGANDYRTGTYSNLIQKFDTETNTLTTLDTYLPNAASCVCALAIGTKIYLFGGKVSGSSYLQKTVSVFNIENEGLSVINVEYPLNANIIQMSAVVEETKICLFLVTSSAQIGITHFDPVENVFIDDFVYVCGDDSEETVAMGKMQLIRANDCVWSFGGTFKTGEVRYYYDCVCIYDFETREFRGSKYDNIPMRCGEIVPVAIDKRVYLFGGSDEYGKIDSIMVFDAEPRDVIWTAYSKCVMNPSIRNTVVSVGDVIYSFGGSIDSGYSDIITTYNTETGEYRILDARLPIPNRSMRAAVVDTKIYLFDGDAQRWYGKNIIQVFDTVDESITQLSNPVCTGSTYGFVVRVGDYTYSTGFGASSIYVYDIKNNTMDTNIYLDSDTFEYEWLWYGTSDCRGVPVGDKIYVFGNGMYRNVCVIDTVNRTFTKTDLELPFENCNMGVAIVGDNAFLFGGEAYAGGDRSSAKQTNSIVRFDMKKLVFEELDVKIPIRSESIRGVAVGNKIYLFPGYSGKFNYNTEVYILDTEKLNNPDQLLISTSPPSHPVTLLNTGDITLQTAVNSVYKGNSDGTCTKVPAHVYENGEWVEI